MSTPARKRLVRDFQRLKKDTPIGVSARPNSDNIMLWNATIHGPENTPWEGGMFRLVIEFTEDYPNVAPNAKFTSKIFHPNVYADGRICLDILEKQWSSMYDACAILTSIQSLLSDPNPASPANCEAAKLLSENKVEYNRRVTEVVERSWMEIDEEDSEEEGGGQDEGKGDGKCKETMTTTRDESGIAEVVEKGGGDIVLSMIKEKRKWDGGGEGSGIASQEEVEKRKIPCKHKDQNLEISPIKTE